MDHFILDTDAFHLSLQTDFTIIVAKFIFDPWKFVLEKKKGSSESLEAQMVEYLREQVVLKPIHLINFSFTQKIVSSFLFCFLLSRFDPTSLICLLKRLVISCHT